MEPDEQNKIIMRPWGYYRFLDQDATSWVKTIVIDPGKSLSRQYHHHRSETWTIISGTGIIELGYPLEYESTGDMEDYDLSGATEKTMFPGDAIFIPKMRTHSIKNPTNMPLTIIEVAYGEYVLEEDIVRNKHTQKMYDSWRYER